MAGVLPRGQGRSALTAAFLHPCPTVPPTPRPPIGPSTHNSPPYSLFHSASHHPLTQLSVLPHPHHPLPLPTSPSPPRHPPANTHCHPLTNPPKYPPPALTYCPHHDSPSLNTQSSISHLSTHHTPANIPSILAAAQNTPTSPALHTHTSTHHPKHPPIHPPGHSSPHPPTCLLPNLPTHLHPHVKSPALTHRHSHLILPTAWTTNTAHPPAPHFTYLSSHPPTLFSTLHPPKGFPLSPTLTPDPISGFLGSTACSQCAQGTMGVARENSVDDSRALTLLDPLTDT